MHRMATMQMHCMWMHADSLSRRFLPFVGQRCELEAEMAARAEERKAVSTEVDSLQKRVAALKEAVAQQRQAIILQCSETDSAIRCETPRLSKLRAWLH